MVKKDKKYYLHNLTLAEKKSNWKVNWKIKC